MHTIQHKPETQSEIHRRGYAAGLAAVAGEPSNFFLGVYEILPDEFVDQDSRVALGDLQKIVAFALGMADAVQDEAAKLRAQVEAATQGRSQASTKLRAVK